MHYPQQKQSRNLEDLSLIRPRIKYGAGSLGTPVFAGAGSSQLCTPRRSAGRHFNQQELFQL